MAGSIINLSLPVRQVFELFWKSSAPAAAAAAAATGAAPSAPAPAGGIQNRLEQEPIGPAMVVTFRLQVCALLTLPPLSLSAVCLRTE